MSEPVEIISFLENVVERVTQHYKSDFRYDDLRLRNCLNESNMEDRTFYWMARSNGTWLVRERDAFIMGSNGHSIWTYYERSTEKIEAYRIVVTGGRNGKPVGKLFNLNYPEQVKRVMQNALPVQDITLFFPSGQQVTLPLESYNQNPDQFSDKYGICTNIRYNVTDEAELTRRLMMEHRYERGWQPTPHKNKAHHEKQR